MCLFLIIAGMTVGSGLRPQQVEELIAKLDALELGRRERTLLPFLQEHCEAQTGTIRAVKPNDILLQCLAGTAPAVVFMPPEVFHAIDQLLQVWSLSCKPDNAAMSRKCSLSNQVLLRLASKLAWAFWHASFDA